MWESIERTLTNENAWQLLTFAAAIAAAALFASKKGLFSFKGKGIRIGTDEVERNIIRQQIEWAHLYIMSLRTKIEADETRYNGYFTKYVLERAYDKVVEWITFNHLNVKNAYIEIKQEEICSLVYGLGVNEEFRTPEFKKRMCGWTAELIEHLVQIREIYNS